MIRVLTPHSYFFYPETSHRSLEEIDFIFAEGYIKNRSYVKVAKEMPRLTIDDMEVLAEEYGLTDSHIIKKSMAKAEGGGKYETERDIHAEEKEV